MSNNYYAVIMGFNDYIDKEHFSKLNYAEKDATDLYNILIDPTQSKFNQENVALIPNNATNDDIEEKLYKFVIQDRNENDIVIVYYSGHSFISTENNKVFLATPHTHIVEILKNPRNGLDLDYLHNDIFMHSKAGTVILILDCCYSGAFVPDNIQTEEYAYKNFFLRKEQFSGKGRIAIVSSSRNGVSRESTEFKNGIFTHFLLEGLQGKARESVKNKENENTNFDDVSLASLISYLQVMVPHEQQPIRYGEEIGRIVLTSVERDQFQSKNELDLIAGKLQKDIHKRIGSTFLLNPLTNQYKFVENFVNEVARERELFPDSISLSVLNGLRKVIDAKYLYIEYYDKLNNIRSIKYDTDRDFIDFETKIEDDVFDNLFPILIQEEKYFNRSKFGFVFPGKNSILNNNTKNLFIPLQIKSNIKEYLIAINVSESYLKYGELIGLSISSIYKSTNEFTRFSIEDIQNAILDDMKYQYGYMPFEIYQARLTNFRNQLSNIVFFFEPIVHLGEREISIDSWEALARNKSSEKVPKEIFGAAQLWGNDFTQILDLLLVEKAIRTFINLLPDKNKNFIQRLSVNIYPCSIMNDKLFNILKTFIKKNEEILGKQLILEISEKKGIPEIENDDEIGSRSIQAFKERIKKFTAELEVQFAIDDFGVGYSSIVRLDKLELPYIKIDRDVLHHTNPSNTIKYVKDYIAKSHLFPTQVILEGVDLDHRITLKEIHDLGINYIQGHIVRKALPNLEDISPETKEILKKLVSGKLPEKKTIAK